MPEDMRSNALLDTCTSRNPLELKIDRSVREGIIVLGDEDRHLGIHRLAGIIILPGSEVFPGHHEADVAGLVGLEVHVHHHSPLVEDQISPSHHANLTDAEASFVEHHDNCTVAAPGACTHHCRDLFRGQEI